jgi:hypothetical protein
MRLTAFPLVTDRRPVLAGLVLALLLGAASMSFAQDAAQQGTPAKPTLTFQNDAGMLIFYIKPDKAADFEDLVTKYKDGLAKMDSPEAKQQASGLKLYKAAATPTALVYVMKVEPAVKGAEYWLLSVLYKAYPAEGQAMFQKWTDAKADIKPNPAVFDLTLVTK